MVLFIVMAKSKKMSQADSISKEVMVAPRNLLIDVEDITKKLESRYDENTFNKIKRFGQLLAKDGLSIEEACILTNIDYNLLKASVEDDKNLEMYIARKRVEFKIKLQQTLASSAIDKKDDKLAQWFLEKKYPEEFDKKNTKNNDNGQDMLAMAIEFIQENGDANPIVNKKSAFFIKGKSESGPEISEILK